MNCGGVFCVFCVWFFYVGVCHQLSHSLKKSVNPWRDILRDVHHVVCEFCDVCEFCGACVFSFFCAVLLSALVLLALAPALPLPP